MAGLKACTTAFTKGKVLKDSESRSREWLNEFLILNVSVPRRPSFHDSYSPAILVPEDPHMSAPDDRRTKMLELARRWLRWRADHSLDNAPNTPGVSRWE